MSIPVLLEDEHLIVVDKPIDLPVHKNKHMPHDAPYLNKLVGEQIGQWIYNVHRLDAKTSGVIVLAKSTDMAKVLTEQFARRSVRKTYVALVKGNPGAGVFDRPVLDRKKGKRVRAETSYQTLRTIQTDIPDKNDETVLLQLSLLELQPSTGRWHQLRQHCSQQRYDIIGDTQHGDWTLNRIITERTGAERLCLHARELVFDHPVTQERLSVEATTPPLFAEVFDQLAT